jgi:hypothetical protein
MAFRKFGTFRTPNGWLTTTGDGEILQRGTKRGEDAVEPTAYQTAFGVSAVENGGNLVINVNAGVINSVSVPACTLTFPIGGGWWHVLLQCNASPAPATFPTSASVIANPTILGDTDSIGYIALAIVTAGAGTSVAQTVTGGLRAERHKYSAPNTATYYFYRT